MCISRSYRGLSRSRWYRRRESPVFRNVNVPVEAPLARLMSTISARTCNWDNASRLSFPPFPPSLLYYSFSRYSGLFIVFKRGSLNGRVRIPRGGIRALPMEGVIALSSLSLLLRLPPFIHSSLLSRARRSNIFSQNFSS